MSSAPAPAKAPVQAPPQTNPVRMGILLGILAIVVAMLVHHFTVAKPATDVAYDDIQNLFDKRNALGVVADGSDGIDAKLVQPKDVQEAIKKQPWSTVTMPDHVIETYWWYGMPHQNYITVLYYKVGDKVRFNTHYKNGKPPAEDLPGAIVNDTGSSTTAPPTKGAPETEKPAMEKPAETPTEKPAEEKPAEAKPAEDKPAEKPAEATEKKAE
ncbi:hypothetical protein [Anatilimnocola floriformis]|uniref:hypothetical protein n=1 Tax=Anatilimnocola floriformis TaxID=2948575 RepID=UPI0020C31E2D|nr:hypothetical protein [Anatilimnocola floriformis]